jgi:hypothetical protein
MRLAWIVLFAAACAHDVRVTYPAPKDLPTGTLVLLMGEPASDVAVSINGQLVVEDAHTSRVEIDHVPVGHQDIALAANGVDKQFQIWIDDEHPTTVPLGIPDPGGGFLKTLFGTLITIVVYSMLHH